MNLPVGLSIVIPCRNEEKTLGEAVTEALQAIALSGIPGEVIVADNQSTDRSAEIGERHGARVVPVPRLGYGAALDTGVRAAKYEYVVFADADMSYPFLEAAKLIEPLKNNTADFVLGSRLQGTIEDGAMPTLNRHMGTPVLSWLIRLMYKMPTSDCNSGMRALRRSQYEELQLCCPGMEYASEMIVRVAQRNNIRYAEIPISFRKDKRGHAPHLKRWIDGWRHLRFILANASSVWTTIGPALIAFAMLAGAFVLSFQSWWVPKEQINFHSAFLLIALSTPLICIASAGFLLKGALHSKGLCGSRLVASSQRLLDTAKPFYASVVLFSLSFVEMGFLALNWMSHGFGPLFNVGALIRIMIYTLLGAALFSVDLCMGIIKLTTQEPLTVNSGEQVTRLATVVRNEAFEKQAANL